MRPPPPQYITNRFLWVLRHWPISSPIFTLVCIALIGISFANEFALGIVMIVFGTLGYVYTIVRYVFIGYRIFNQKHIRTGVLEVFDLKTMEFVTIAAIITGMYMIDSSPTKTTYVIHPSFGPGKNTYYVWWYIVMTTISVLTGTGYSNMIENDLSAITVFSVGIAASEFTTLVVLASLVGYWAYLGREKKKPTSSSSS